MHFLQPHNLGNISQQFGDFQSWVISSSVRELEPAGLTLACLIALTASPATPNCKPHTLPASQARRFETAVRLDWKIGSRHDARHLSVWTTLALARVQEWQPYGLAREHLMGVLSARALKSGVVLPLETIWEQLLTTAMGWLQNHLPASSVRPCERCRSLKRHAAQRGSGANKAGAVARRSRSGATGRPLTRCTGNAFEAALLGRPASVRSGAVHPSTSCGTASADQRIKCQQA